MAPTVRPDPADRAILSRFMLEVFTALVLAGVGIGVVFGAVEYDIGWDEAGPQPGYFPFRIGLIMTAASLGVLVQAFVGRRSGETFLTRQRLARVAAFFLPVAAFVVGAIFLGLYVAMLLYLFAAMLIQGGYRWPVSAAVSLGVTAFFFVLFEWWFTVPLLKGPLEALIGIY
jgi:hypothetical protein